jgi:MFS family permease
MTAHSASRRPQLALVALLTGTMLAPLNSSMVAVALTPIQRSYDVSLPTVSWLVTAFYLTACVAQPVMGRIADAYGPRHVFVLGMVAATLATTAAPFSDSVGVLVLCRVLQAIGVSTAFPCAMVLLRRDGRGGRLFGVAAVNTTAGAVGPVLGGLLTTYAGWEAIFWVNLPLTLGAIAVALVALGPDPHRAGRGLRATVTEIDPVGILAFTAAIIGILEVMLTLRGGDLWPGALLCVTAGAVFFLRESRATQPFIDVRALWSAPGLLAVLATFVLFNLAYYGAFYGLPQWLQTTRDLAASEAGLLILPIAAMGALSTLAGSALMRVVGVGRTLVVASVLLTAGLAGLAGFDGGTPLWVIALEGAILGVPYGLGNLGLQRLMYERSPASVSGVVGGLFQSARYLGAILAVGLVGALAPRGSTAGLHALGTAMAIVATAVLVLTVRDLVHHGRSASTPSGPAPERRITVVTGVGDEEQARQR